MNYTHSKLVGRDQQIGFTQSLVHWAMATDSRCGDKLLEYLINKVAIYHREGERGPRCYGQSPTFFIYVGFHCDLIPIDLHVFSDTHFLKPCQIQGVPADTENYYGVRPKDMVNILLHMYKSILFYMNHHPMWNITLVGYNIFHPLKESVFAVAK